MSSFRETNRVLFYAYIPDTEINFRCRRIIQSFTEIPSEIEDKKTRVQTDRLPLLFLHLFSSYHVCGFNFSFCLIFLHINTDRYVTPIKKLGNLLLPSHEALIFFC